MPRILNVFKRKNQVQIFYQPSVFQIVNKCCKMLCLPSFPFFFFLPFFLSFFPLYTLHFFQQYFDKFSVFLLILLLFKLLFPLPYNMDNLLSIFILFLASLNAMYFCNIFLGRSIFWENVRSLTFSAFA